MPAPKRICGCGCGRLVSKSTEERHRAGVAPTRILATQLLDGLRSACPPVSATPRPSKRQQTEAPGPISGEDPIELPSTVSHQFAQSIPQNSEFNTSFHADDLPEESPPQTTSSVQCSNDEELASGPEEFVQPALHRPRVPVSDDSEEDEGEDRDDDVGIDSDDELLNGLGEHGDEEGIYDYYSPVDELTEAFEQELTQIAEELTDEEISYLRHFALKIETHMSDQTYEKLEFAFPESQFESYKLTKSRVEFLAQLKPVPYDCCPASCCCFVGPHADLDTCPYCQEPRYNAQGRPRKRFTYVPLIPRLKAFYETPSADLAAKMRYRADFQPDEHIIQDYIDGSNYKRLREQNVTINEHQFPHRFFEDLRDIALGFSTDGFSPFKRHKKTCWPLLIYNYNLPPKIRFWFQHILCIGVIPGPKKPKDFDSFFWPAIEEFLKLARGVRCLDRRTFEHFWLRAYLILCFGDIPAMSMIMRIKGHNGLLPCRMCQIRGLRIPDSRNPVHYVPLDRSKHPSTMADASAIQVYDPTSLPHRTHEQFMAQAREVQFAVTNTDSEALAKLYGIKGVAILASLTSLFFPASFPYDFMHLVFENVMKNLILLWTGNYKDLDEGEGDYQLASHVWEAIGAATAASARTIPSAFAASPCNVADDKSSSTADMWSFWLQYLGPVLLSQKFRRAVYFTHFVALVKLVRICLQFELTAEDMQTLRDGFPKWVQKYEELYYQYTPDRLPVCPLTIHALLHIPDSIIETGPVWTSWAFLTERFCGRLLPAIRSRCHPFANLDNFVVAAAQLNQIKVKYDLFEVLLLKRRRTSRIPNSFSHADYPTCVLLQPRRQSSTIPNNVEPKVAACLSTRFNKPLSTIRKYFSMTQVEQWARVRRLGDGDEMRASALNFDAEDRRDSTFVRYDQLVDIHENCRAVAPEFSDTPTAFYGQLLHILVVRLPAATELDPQLRTESIYILAVVHSCKIEALNSLGMPIYSKMGRTEVIDITCLQCLIGRIPVLSLSNRRGGDRWAIIDCTGATQQSVHLRDE